MKVYCNYLFFLCSDCCMRKQRILGPSPRMRGPGVKAVYFKQFLGLWLGLCSRGLSLRLNKVSRSARK